jgi:ACR3 family arsenite efflux pump ArsB
MINEILVYLILVLIIGNLYVTYKLLRSEYYEKQQKIYQFLIIWLLPFIGMIVVLMFLSEDDKITKRQNNSNNDNNYYESGGFSGDSGVGSGGD